jgi:vitamin B12 transporter
MISTTYAGFPKRPIESNSAFIQNCITRQCRRATTILSLLFFLLVSLASQANAGQGGRVEGTVTDPSGARVAEARVLLVASAGRVYQTRTDDNGRFIVADITDGVYSLTVEAPGLSQLARNEVVVRDGGTETVEVKLNVAAISDYQVVTPTRTQTATDELATSVSVITGDNLQRSSQSLISESLRSTPGLAVLQTGGRGGLTSVFVRGGESDYNKVLIDGVPVNAAGGAFDFSALTPENVERIEVVRGPGSSLFGSDAMTSVVQLVTRRGSTSVPEFELSGEGGSFSYHRETARLAGLTRWFDYSTSFGFQTTDGRFRNSDYTNRSASANLGFHLAPKADLRVTSRWNNNTVGVPGATAVLFSDPDQRQKHRDLALAGALDLRTTAHVHQTARFVYSEADTTSFDPVAQDLSNPATPALPPGAFGDDFAFTFRDHQKRLGFQYQVIAALGSHNVVTGGLDFDHESADLTSDFSSSSPSRNSLGVYIQDQASWRERLFVTGGLRVERNTGGLPDDFREALRAIDSSAPVGDVGFGYAVSPKISAAFVAHRHQEGATLGATTLKASFGRGIKAPRFDEAFSPSPFFLGNPALEPERATSFDLGIVQEFLGRRASLEATYFDNRFRDLIVFRFDPATFGPIMLPDGRLTNFINLDRASARGLELVAAARPLWKFRIAGSYTFLRSRVERAENPLDPEIGLPLLRRPRNSGAFELTWVDRRFDVRLDGSAVGERRDINPITGARFDGSGRAVFNDGYVKVNASGSLMITRRLTAFSRVENLLNQDYEEVLGFPAYRLNFTAGLRIRIGGDK